MDQAHARLAAPAAPASNLTVVGTTVGQYLVVAQLQASSLSATATTFPPFIVIVTDTNNHGKVYNAVVRHETLVQYLLPGSPAAAWPLAVFYERLMLSLKHGVLDVPLQPAARGGLNGIGGRDPVQQIMLDIRPKDRSDDLDLRWRLVQPDTAISGVVASADLKCTHDATDGQRTLATTLATLVDAYKALEAQHAETVAHLHARDAAVADMAQELVVQAQRHRERHDATLLKCRALINSKKAKNKELQRINGKLRAMVGGAAPPNAFLAFDPTAPVPPPPSALSTAGAAMPPIVQVVTATGTTVHALPPIPAGPVKTLPRQQPRRAGGMMPAAQVAPKPTKKGGAKARGKRRGLQYADDENEDEETLDVKPEPGVSALPEPEPVADATAAMDDVTMGVDMNDDDNDEQVITSSRRRSRGGPTTRISLTPAPLPTPQDDGLLARVSLKAAVAPPPPPAAPVAPPPPPGPAAQLRIRSIEGLADFLTSPDAPVPDIGSRGGRGRRWGRT
ncbi:hypothetical protein AMAG_10510 [Allomyces macrogynus ATCC 38327]|uniref:Uncharacterized protein n=1 Tax=Allomyces macrogynus (strain ATCC 38327) TaxID=578462 RepID=A0A0L0SUZ0_ALLM3|nr:hypothetical protein AMAG_10510 [Allomyces macrogynus ATCC 38327]|eukprot:KNE66281.1 hypothetical protein AMAG_10510 [Allomyces macrogynus ATCC 38327]